MNKLKLISVGTSIIMVIGFAAVIGTLAGLALSFTSLPPLVTGGIISSVFPALLFCISLSGILNKLIGKLINSFDEILTDIESEKRKVHSDKEQLKEFEEFFKELHEDLKKILNSTGSIKYYAKSIINVIFSFAIGIGLVTLGFTLPAAIGALAFTATSVIFSLIDKAVDCFSSKEPSNVLSEDVEVNRNPTLNHKIKMLTI